jgi:glutamate formiminotransferase/formiminotetrahydrofolate cyclodeaminase
MGATDVLPFVPVGSTTLERCVGLARQAGERIGQELGIPVYLYEAAATRPSRQNLADVRRGEFEGIAATIGTDPERAPDFGPAAVHPSAGAIAVGARLPLLAFNVNLGTRDVEVAKKIAKAIRFQSGGLCYVKALGFELTERGIVQVSMNLVNTWGTGPPGVRAHQGRAERCADRGKRGGGLVVQDALLDVAEHALRLENFSRQQVLENRLATPIGAAELGLPEFLGSVASSEPTPGGGSVSALAGALASALGTMVARLTIGKKRYAEHGRRCTAWALARGAPGGSSTRVRDPRIRRVSRGEEDVAKRTPEEVASRAKASRMGAERGARSMRTAETCVRVPRSVAVATRGVENPRATRARRRGSRGRVSKAGRSTWRSICLSWRGGRADLGGRRAPGQAAELCRTVVEAVERRIQASMASS